MNLPAALNYRIECFIHKLPMQNYTPTGSSFSELIEIKDLTLAKLKSLASTVCIIRQCKHCRTTLYHYKGPSITTINDMMYPPTHTYLFYLIDGNIGLNREDIFYHDKNNFYRMSINLETKEVVFQLGKYDRSQTIENLARSVSTMKSTDFDPTSIQNLDSLINKIKLYNLYS